MIQCDICHKNINNYIDSDIGLVRIPDYFEGGSSNEY